MIMHVNPLKLKNKCLDDDREGTVLTKYVTNIRVIAGNVMAYI